MRKSILIYFIFLAICNSNTNAMQVDSMRIDSSFKAIEQKLTSIERINDSLSKETFFYKVKEDYYSEALSNQTTMYGVMTASLLAILSIISFVTFKYELRNLKRTLEEKINKHVENDKKQLGKYQIGLARSYVNGGNVNQIVKIQYENNNELHGAAYYNLFAAYNHFLAAKEFLDSDASDKIRISTSELALVKKILIETQSIVAKLNKEDVFAKSMAINYMFWMDEMSKSEDEELKNLVASVRVNLIPLTDNS